MVGNGRKIKNPLYTHNTQGRVPFEKFGWLKNYEILVGFKPNRCGWRGIYSSFFTDTKTSTKKDQSAEKL